jgi:hypothetical protein
LSSPSISSKTSGLLLGQNLACRAVAHAKDVEAALGRGGAFVIEGIALLHRGRVRAYRLNGGLPFLYDIREILPALAGLVFIDSAIGHNERGVLIKIRAEDIL